MLYKRMRVRAIYKLLFQLVAAVIGMYGLLLVYLYANQRTLIFPGSLLRGTSTSTITPPNSNGEIVSLQTPSGVSLTGYLAPSAGVVHPTGKTILFLYGNGSTINTSWYIVDHFINLGCDVMMVDYPGYGASGGSASDIGCYEAAGAAYDYLTTVKKTPTSRIIVAGWSLGSSVAIHLAAHHPVAGLMTFSAFTTMADMANRQYPIVPECIINILLKYKFPSLRTIAQVHCPTLIAHGANDDFVPPAMAEKLASADKGPVTRIVVPNVGHNDILSDGGPGLYDGIGKWVEGLARARE
jgi:uncharacterized protein